MEISQRRTEKIYLKLAIGSIAALVLLIVGIWAGHGAYVTFQEKRLLRQARFALAEGNNRAANLAARAILESKPSSIGAARMMAEVAERVGDRSAIDWRRKVTESPEHTVEDVLAWARAGLRFGDVAMAERALSAVEESGRQTAGYHAVAALLAQAHNDSQRAEQEWAEAVRLGPNEKMYRLQLGIVRIHSTDPERHDSGLTILKELRGDAETRSAATRTLITEGIARRENSGELLQLAHDLQDYPEATLRDRIVYADLLRQMGDPQFSAYLTALEQKAATKPVDLAELLSWMSRSSLNLLALDFVKRLPSDTVEKWPVPLVLAEISAQLSDWRRLENATKSANWRDFDFLRLAYLTRALRAQNKSVAAEHEWTGAVKAASANSTSILSLTQTISDWGWEPETVDLLWALAKYPEKQREAFQTLYRYYSRTGDTAGLYRVLARLAELDSTNLDVENNLAQVSLLLNATPDEARRLAADVYRKEPSNPAYAATYAYSLLSKGDAKGAVKIMNSLTAEQLRDPAIGTYYGICLAALKDERAREFLDDAQKATLLPEEKTLVEKARATLDQLGKNP